jgi:hypothetical protein
MAGTRTVFAATKNQTRRVKRRVGPSKNVETKSPNPGVISLTLLMAALKATAIALGKREGVVWLV